MVMSKAQVRITAALSGVKTEALVAKSGITCPDLTEASATLETVHQELQEYVILRKHGHDAGTAPSPTYQRVFGFSIPADKVDAALAMFKG